MMKGHLDQTRQNQRTTKPRPTTIVPDSDDPCLAEADEFIPSGSPTKTHQRFATFMEPTGQIYTDQTGRFVSPSSNGNNYLMILYDYNSNFIFASSMPKRFFMLTFAMPD
jgi:hypothetical protein